MPCGVTTPLRGRTEAHRPGVCLPFVEWAGKKSISQYPAILYLLFAIRPRSDVCFFIAKKRSEQIFIATLMF